MSKVRLDILIAIAWLTQNGISVNKQRISTYTGYSWITVHKHYKDLAEHFLIENRKRFERRYNLKSMKGGKKK